jgi:uncharacterized membrane protein
MKFESFLKWWLLFTLLVVATIFCNYLGYLKLLWQKDSSYLCITTLVLFFVMSIKCGRDIFLLESKKDHDGTSLSSFRRKEEVLWFSSEVCLNLGMLGTIIGFCLMLVGFENLDISNQQTVQGLLAELGKSMATALYTTLVGLMCGQILKVQAFLLSLHLNKLEKNQDSK